jgi:hypothetical protein
MKLNFPDNVPSMCGDIGKNTETSIVDLLYAFLAENTLKNFTIFVGENIFF